MRNYEVCLSEAFGNPAYRYVAKDAEVLIQGEIPKSAYAIHKKGKGR